MKPFSRSASAWLTGSTLRAGLGAGTGAEVDFTGADGRSAVTLPTAVAAAWTVRRAVRPADLASEVKRDVFDEPWFMPGFCTHPWVDLDVTEKALAA